MYFGIIGERKELSYEGLAYIHATDIIQIKPHIITFESHYPERFATCASLIKRGEVLDINWLQKITIWPDVGVSSKDFWVHLKNTFPTIKRFKLVDLIHTDKEIKEQWQEIINIDTDRYGKVIWYQPIGLYETIDFEKPSSGMGIGMMPSKLALTLINIGIGEYESNSNSIIQNSELTIWDPFCGFGTTNFLANYLGYHTIGSDLNPTQVKHNRKRRTADEEWLWTSETLWTFLKQDVTHPLKNPIYQHADIIVSEGRLGPVVTNRTGLREVEQYSRQVLELYTSFAKNITNLYKTNDKSSIEKRSRSLVITIPVWLKQEISISEDILQQFIALGREASLIAPPYSRLKQLVGRQILVAKFKS